MKRLLVCGMVVMLTAVGAQAEFTLIGQSGDSVGPVGDAGNTILNHNFAGTDFVPQEMVVEGDLTEVQTGTYASEARFYVTDPSAATWTSVGWTSTGGYTDTIHVGPSTQTMAGLGGSALGAWSFEMFESYDDGAGVDQEWSNLNITIQPGDPPPSLADFVDHTYAGVFSHSANNSDYANDMEGGTGDPFSGTSHPFGDVIYELNWAGGDMFLELLFTHTDGDLDLFLYDSPQPSSPVDYGYSSSDNEDAEYLAAPAGTYYIRVDGYNSATYGGENDFTLNVTPEPASLALLVLGGLAVLRRRR